MPIIKSGILGGYKGTISQVTGYRRKGKNIISCQNKIKSIQLASSLVSNSQKMDQLFTKWNYWGRQIERIMKFYGIADRVNPNDLYKYNKGFNDYENPYSSGTWFFPEVNLPFRTVPSSSYNQTAKTFNVILSKAKRNYGYYQSSKYRRFGALNWNGIPFYNIINDNQNNAAAGGSFAAQPIGRPDCYGVILLNAALQNTGDFICMSNMNF